MLVYLIFHKHIRMHTTIATDSAKAYEAIQSNDVHMHWKHIAVNHNQYQNNNYKYLISLIYKINEFISCTNPNAHTQSADGGAGLLKVKYRSLHGILKDHFPLWCLVCYCVSPIFNITLC